MLGLCLVDSSDGQVTNVGTFLEMSQTSDAEGLSVGIPSAHFITIHMPADELVARLSLDLGQL